MATDITTLAIAIAGVIIILGLIINWFSRKIKISSAILIILLGVILGPVLGLFNPSEWSGIVKSVVTFALVVVLFDTGYKMKIRSIKSVILSSTSLTTLAVLVTIIFGSLIAIFFFKLPWQLAVLMGAIVASTDITVVAPLMENIRLPQKLVETLQLEATLNSPYAAIIATTMAILVTSEGIGEGLLAFIGKTFLYQILIGIGLGILFGYGFVALLKHLNLESSPQLLSIGLILITFAVSEFIGASGVFSVFIMGIILGNSQFQLKTIIHEFESTISLVIIIFVFVLFGALLNLTTLLAMGIAGLIFIAVVTVSRSLSVIIYSRGRWGSEEKMLFLIEPRGMVCAVLALSYMHLFPNPNAIISTVFGIMIITIILASFAQYLVKIKLSKTNVKAKKQAK